MAKATGKSQFGTMTFMVIFGLFWTAGTLTGDIVFGLAAIRQTIAVGYATTDGVVIDSKVIKTRGGHGSTNFRPSIKYAYAVNGKKFVGDRCRYGDFAGPSDAAQRIVAANPVNQKITVFYSPSDPADAVLFTGIEGSDLFVEMFLTPFNAVMFGIWWGFAMELRKRRRPPVAGGVKLWDDGYQTRVRLPRITPVGVGLGFVVGLAFVGIFVLAFTVGPNPPLAVAAGAWGVVLSTSLIAYLAALTKQSGGAVDLVIDDLDRSVTLPRTFGRKESQVAPAKSLKSVAVDDIVRRSSKGKTSHTYAPTLIWTDGDGVEHRDKLAEWISSDSAESFAVWLRERLRLDA